MPQTEVRRPRDQVGQTPTVVLPASVVPLIERLEWTTGSINTIASSHPVVLKKSGVRLDPIANLQFDVSKDAQTDTLRRNSINAEEYYIGGDDLRDLIGIAARATNRRAEGSQTYLQRPNDEVITCRNYKSDAVVRLSILGIVMIAVSSGLLLLSFMTKITLIDPVVGVIVAIFGLTFFAMGRLNAT